MVRSSAPSPISELNERSREIFRLIVDGYVQTGEPIGSRTLSRLLGQNLSPATIRNVMADLEEAGLLYSPHTSAGRLPTEAGLRLFVHGLLELGNLAEDERQNIESLCAARGKSLSQALEEATSALSGLSHCAGVVVVPKQERPLKHIEFVHLGPGPGARRAGHRGRAGREPGHRGAARPAALDAGLGRQFPEFAADRPHDRGGAQPTSTRRSARTRRSSTR